MAWRANVSIFLQTVIVLIGIGALGFLLGEPHLEGRNAHATLFEIYFNDAFLAYAYIASIPFFMGLYHAFTIAGYIRRQGDIAQAISRSLRTIRSCAVAIIGFAVPAVAYLMIVRPDDDIAGGVFMGVLVVVGSSIVIAATTILRRKINRTGGRAA